MVRLIMNADLGFAFELVATCITNLHHAYVHYPQMLQQDAVAPNFQTTCGTCKSDTSLTLVFLFDIKKLHIFIQNADWEMFGCLVWLQATQVSRS